jgi:DNA-binding IclR family transcriptional regulator
MSEHAQRVLTAMRNGSPTMRIVDIRHATGLVTTEVRDALAELCSQRLVASTSWGMRYQLRDRTTSTVS